MHAYRFAVGRARGDPRARRRRLGRGPSIGHRPLGTVRCAVCNSNNNASATMPTTTTTTTTTSAAGTTTETVTVTAPEEEPTPPPTATVDGLTLPGHLGDEPDGGTGSDRRLHAKMAGFFNSAGMGGNMSEAPWDPSTPMEQQIEMMHAADAGYIQLLGMEPVVGLTDQIIEESKWITSSDGSFQIELRVLRKKGTEGQVLPCLYHTHGGGMAIQTSRDRLYNNHLEMLVAGPSSETHPIVAIAVEFRNTIGAPKAESRPGNPQAAMDYPPSPFPLGLDDCLQGIKYVHENKADLKISTITVSGESGGGNLCTACSLYAKRKGCLQIIDGVYSLCPYIAGSWPNKSLLSTFENDGIFVGCAFMNLLGEPLYQGGDDPCAWPLKATIEDLKGLPPHVISVNECDPLRDEGREYFRMLDKAGVEVAGRMCLGTSHAGDYFHNLAPDAGRDTHASMKAFMYSLPKIA
jgi:acetyl esterase